MGKAQDFAQYPSESNTNKQYSTSTEFSTEKNSTMYAVAPIVMTLMADAAELAQLARVGKYAPRPCTTVLAAH